MRHSVVDGYLRPALNRSNLTVRTDARVVLVLLDGRKATGVRLRDGQVITARRGVILAAGSLRTPQLLMLSGVGPAAQLSEHGIPVLPTCPAVPVVRNTKPSTASQSPAITHDIHAT